MLDSRSVGHAAKKIACRRGFSDNCDAAEMDKTYGHRSLAPL
jgi:hypothetical protein